ncbi:MAG: hypothetical protein IKL41_02210, partial [Clostridia bacterium]|nr:hypothetical protein [Clostridia bacterium]
MSIEFSNGTKTPSDRKSLIIITTRRLALVVLDILAVSLAFLIVSAINYPKEELYSVIFPALMGRALYTSLIFVLIHGFFGLYNSLWEYAGVHELLRCAGAAVLGTLTSLGIDTVLDRLDMYNVVVLRVSVYFTAVLLITAMTGAIRLVYRALRRISKAHSHSLHIRDRRRVMIIGAGDMGLLVYKELEAKSFGTGKPVVFVDDSPMKTGRHVEGVPIKGTCDDIPELALKYKVDEI